MAPSSKPTRPRILVLQTSNLVRDSRILRQLELLAPLGDVTTVGFGSAPTDVHAHVELPNGTSSLPSSAAGVARLALRRHAAAEGMSRFATQVLERVPRGDWDLVVSNNARTFDAAFAIADGAPVWTDLHEWHPDEQGQIRRWKLLVAPYFTHLCERYLPRAALITTVAEDMTDLYEERFGVHSLVLPNAPRYEPMTTPARQDERIRMVFVGAAEASRGIDALVDAAALLPAEFELDLYLVPGSSPRYFEELSARVERTPGARICEPVPPARITSTLAEYDLGVYAMPIINRNVEVTIPNKFFDFVHAQLGVVIGPIPQMARIVEEHGIGVVAPGFTGADLARAVTTIDRDAIARFRQASARAAPTLSFDAYEPPVMAALDEILGR